MKLKTEPTAQLLNLSTADYLADKIFDTPTISPSQIKTLVNQSAAHLYLEHPKLGNQPKPVTEEQRKRRDKGNLSHKLILGAGKEYQVIIGFDDYKKAEARELRDGIRAQGLVPVLEYTFDECVKAAEIIKEKITQRGINLCGQSEMMMTFTETADDGSDVLCRIMPDHFIYKTADIFELKNPECAHPMRCESTIDALCYDVQMYAYLTGLAQLYPELAGRLEFTWIFYETEPPYCITIAQPDGTLRELGKRRWKKAINQWAQCLKTNEWPGYSEGVIKLSAKMWRLKEEIGEEFFAE